MSGAKLTLSVDVKLANDEAVASAASAAASGATTPLRGREPCDRLLTPSARSQRAAAEAERTFANAIRLELPFERDARELLAAIAADSLDAATIVLDRNPFAAAVRPLSMGDLSLRRQFACEPIVVSSERTFGPRGQGAAKLAGKPTVTGKKLKMTNDAAPGSWFPLLAGAGREWVEFAIAEPVFATQVIVYESCRPGTVVSIEAMLPNGTWTLLWQDAPAAVAEPSRVLSPPTYMLPVPVSRFRVVMDTAAFEPELFKGLDGFRVDGDAVSQLAANGRPLVQPWQKSALMIAARNGNPELVSMLLARGADPLRKSVFGLSALDMAIVSAQPDAGETFNSLAASPSLADRVVLDMARPMRGRHLEVAAMLLAADQVDSHLNCIEPFAEPEPTPLPTDGRFPLWLVSHPSPEELSDEYREAREAALARPRDELEFAARAARKKPSPQLFNVSGHAFAQNALGETALHHAVRAQNLNVIALLLAHAPELAKLVNDMGLSAYDVASQIDAPAVHDALNQARGALCRADEVPAELDDEQLARHVEVWGARHVARARTLPLRGNVLTAALSTGRLDLVSVLLARGAMRFLIMGSPTEPYDPEAPVTAPVLHMALNTAAAIGSAALVRLVLSQPLAGRLEAEMRWSSTVVAAAAVRIAPFVRRTPMHLAVAVSHADMARVLLAQPVAAQWMEMRAKDGTQPLDRCVSMTVAEVISIARTRDARARGLATPSAVMVVADGGSMCSLCWMPLPPGEKFLFECACEEALCEPCVRHLATTAVFANETPRCPDSYCSRAVPPRVLRRVLTFDQLVLVNAIAVNSRLTVDRASAAHCSVCSRINDLSRAYDRGKARYQCGHCNVALCAICSQVWPQLGPGDWREGSVRMAEVREFLSAISTRSSVTRSSLRELDSALHVRCEADMRVVQLFREFQRGLETRAVPACPRCGLAGAKDTACSHIRCERCAGLWCFSCGRSSESLADISVHDHACSPHQWEDNETYCPMRLCSLALVDARVCAAGCGTACIRTSVCTRSSTCYVDRDSVAQALLNEMRVRCYILAFIATHGRASVRSMLERMGMLQVISANFFGSRFDWETDAPLPPWWSFEPPEVQTFYARRLRWFVLPGDIDTFRRLMGHTADAARFELRIGGGGLGR